MDMGTQSVALDPDVEVFNTITGEWVKISEMPDEIREEAMEHYLRDYEYYEANRKILKANMEMMSASGYSRLCTLMD